MRDVIAAGLGSALLLAAAVVATASPAAQDYLQRTQAAVGQPAAPIARG